MSQTADRSARGTPWDSVISALDAPFGFMTVVLLLAAVWGLALTEYKPGDVKDALAALAILLGGVWTLYQFVLRRAFESALGIDVSVTTAPLGSRFVTFVNVTLMNCGNRRISAPPQLSAGQVDAYEQSIAYPCDLQLRSIPSGATGFIGWWSKTNGAPPVVGVPEHVSLLFEYTRTDGLLDFFMEPGERYNASATFVLPPGSYMLKVVFVGARATAAEFWSRIVAFNVPALK